jgi:hypothetical protein
MKALPILFNRDALLNEEAAASLFEALVQT